MGGQKKKANAAEFVGTKEFTAFCEQAVPQIAGAIDSKDGFCTLEEVQAHPAVKEIMTNPPAICKKVTVKLIMEQYPDFISFFEGGRVATAKGYDNGYVNADGTVNTATVKKKKKGKAITEDKEIVKKDMAAYDKLLQDFQKILKTGTTHEMEQQYQKVAIERKKLKKNGTLVLPKEKKRIMKPEVKSSSDTFNLDVIIKAMQAVKQEGKTCTVGHLAMREDIRALGLGKLGNYISKHPDALIVTPSGDKPPHDKDISVKPSYKRARNKAAQYHKQTRAANLANK